MTQPSIAGYAYRSPDLARSPLDLADLDLLKATVLLGDDDLAALRRSRQVLAGQVEEILDVWYGFVGDDPHLLAAFSRPSDGQPQADYLAAVRARFGQWILDTADAQFDQAWLDWQEEIALRHHRARKNRTDGADAAPYVPFRYLVALLYPITATLRPFLAKGGASAEEVDAMHQAWGQGGAAHRDPVEPALRRRGRLLSGQPGEAVQEHAEGALVRVRVVLGARPTEAHRRPTHLLERPRWASLLAPEVA